VFTNGVFDLGNALIVGVNSDRSVRANKGANRPINSAEERVEILLALQCVDAAAVFDEDTPLAIITLIQPDILVKGADWGADNIVGRDVVERRGGRVVRVELAKGFSTTGLIRKMRPGNP
jgi:rfaE bifunctional protein nucleotidyltransferase chain/domain